MGKTIAVCSGRGGEGKTTIALSLAVGAAKRGDRTILLDASGTARSSDMILGMENVIALDMADVAAGEASIQAALYPVNRYSGLQMACASLRDEMTLSSLSGTILALQSMSDVLVIDMPTGATDLGHGILCDRDAMVVVLKPEEISLRACERLTSRLREETQQVHYVLNHADRELKKKRIQIDMDTVQMVLDCVIAAEIPEDRSIPMGVLRGKPAVECDGPAWKPLAKMVEDLLRI